MVLPDSPRWLLAHGRADEAVSVLCQLEDKEADHPDVVEKKREIEASLKLESAGGKQVLSLTLLDVDGLRGRPFQVPRATRTWPCR
jgi:hypothetical protein